MVLRSYLVTRSKMLFNSENHIGRYRQIPPDGHKMWAKCGHERLKQVHLLDPLLRVFQLEFCLGSARLIVSALQAASTRSASCDVASGSRARRLPQRSSSTR